MEDFHINSTSQVKIYMTFGDTIYVVTCIIICIGLPLTLWALYAVYSLVQNDHVAPIYVINLLISDLIQLCCLIAVVAQPGNMTVFQIVDLIYNFAVTASVCFMVCIALERYLVIACPLWYRFRRTIKISVIVCVLVWVLPLLYFVTFYILVRAIVIRIIASIFLLLPLPLFIFFLVGTIKALSASHISSDEKRRIVGILVLVMLIYMLLFLPRIIWLLEDTVRYDFIFDNLSRILVNLSPIADLALYIFMRKGTVDKLLASVCCHRIDDTNISTV